MYRTKPLQLALFACVSMPIFSMSSSADVIAADNLVEGPILSPRRQVNTIDTPLKSWPEEVRYSSGSISTNPQDAGSTLRNLTFFQKNSDLPFYSRVVGEVFKIPAGDGNQMLEKIFLTARVILKDNKPLRFEARLLDLGEKRPLEYYEAGKNLLTGNSTFPIATPNKGADRGQIVGLTFTGADRVLLKAGRWYAFEIVSAPENNPDSEFTWLRNDNNQTMPKCMAYRVPFTETTTDQDVRTVIANRQLFIGVKTSPAN